MIVNCIKLLEDALVGKTLVDFSGAEFYHDEIDPRGGKIVRVDLTVSDGLPFFMVEVECLDGSFVSCRIDELCTEVK